MKPTMALKPLVFALAAVMTMAAQAGGNGNGHGDDHGHHGPKGPTWEEQLSINASAMATVMDEQNSDGNEVLNQGTKKTPPKLPIPSMAATVTWGRTSPLATETNKTTPQRWLPLTKASSSARLSPPQVPRKPIPTTM
nr:hypothetical protein GCM10020185_72260 [Pseudomonas brassicacearum subsp. brassicacearum]